MEKPKKRDLKKEPKTYMCESSLYRLLKFVEDQQERDPTGATWCKPEDMTPRKSRRIFTDPHAAYRQEDIEIRFRQLMERLSVYEPESNLYRIKNSKIICKVFDSQIRKYEKATMDTKCILSE